MEKLLTEKLNFFAQQMEERIIECDNDLMYKADSQEEVDKITFKKELFELILVEFEYVFEDVLYNG